MRVEDLLINPQFRKPNFCVIDEVQNWELTTLCEKSYLLGNILLYQRVEKLDRVGVLCDNSASFIIAVFSILSVGGIAVPIDSRLPEHEIKNIILECGIKCMCVARRGGRQFANRYDTQYLLNSCVILDKFRGQWENRITLQNNLDFQYQKQLPDTDPAFILFSSGTGGVAKGIVLTHRAILKNMSSIADCLNLNERDTVYIAKSMTHSSTLTGEILVALKAGANLIAYNPVVSSHTILNRIEKMKPTFIGVNPTLLKLILKVKSRRYDTRSVRTVYCSGAPAKASLFVEAKQLFSEADILNVYGLTEAGPRVTAQRAAHTGRMVGCVGKPLEGVKVEIRGKDGRTCQRRQSGCIYVKSNSLMSGYWKDKEKTDQKISDGWLNTGDIGYWKENGELFVIGRADDMILRGAHNVDPEKIENVVNSISGVVDSIVFGIPDEINGNSIVCALKLEKDTEISGREILQYCKLFLASYEYPQKTCIWGEIPRTVSGKVSRALARKKYNEKM